MPALVESFESPDRVRFHIQGWEPDHKPKAVLGLVHGLGEHTGRYKHVGTVMSATGLALVGFDLRGHGQTGGRRGHFPSLNVVMQDIRQFVGFLSNQFTDVPVFLYGHSLGGLLALAYAIQYSAGLRGVIVTGPGLRSALQKQHVKVAMAKILGAVVPSITISSGLNVEAISRDPNVVEEFKKDPLVHKKASLGLGKAALTAIDLCFAQATKFTLPLLIMHGTSDQITYHSGSEDFARLAKQENRDVTLILWNGLFHEIHNEPERSDVFGSTIEWVEGHL